MTEHMGNEVFVHFTVDGLALTARVAADQLQGLPTARSPATVDEAADVVACIEALPQLNGP